MFSTIINTLGHVAQENEIHTNRLHTRHNNDKRCVVVVGGKMHPVENWSTGGVLFTGDERLYAIGQECTFTLKFKLHDSIINIAHKGIVVRKNVNKIALRFAKTDKQTQNIFQKVIDDFVTQNFLETQKV